MRYDAIGNIVYGYLGTHFGFRDTILFLGGGYTQIKDWNTRTEWLFTLFGDDPIDRRYIEYEIKIYNSSH